MKRKGAKLRSGWTTMASLVFVANRKDDRTLLVYLGPEPGMLDQWHLLALESAGGSTQAVLDNYAHTDQGTVFGLEEAMVKAQRFAKAWQRRSGAALEQCDCEDIDKASNA